MDVHILAGTVVCRRMVPVEGCDTDRQDILLDLGDNRLAQHTADRKVR